MPSTVFGVGCQFYTSVNNFLSPALTGQLSADYAIKQFKQEMGMEAPAEPAAADKTLGKKVGVQ